MGDLSKLTIPKLKALCKEKKFTGYSKLNKSGLIAKILENQSQSNGTGTPAVISDGGSTSTAQKLSAAPAVGHPRETPPNCAPRHASTTAVIEATGQPHPNTLALNHDTQTTTYDFTPSRAHTSRSTAACESVPSAQAQGSPLVPMSSPLASGRLPVGPPSEKASNMVKRRVDVTTEGPKAKKRKPINAPLVEESTGPRAPIPPSPDPQVTKFKPQGGKTQKAFQDNLPILSERSVYRKTKKKGFAPLVPALPPNNTRREAGIVHASAVPNPGHMAVCPVISDTSFEFLSDDTPIALHPVIFPPSISQRKKVQNLSVVFSLLDETDLASLYTLSRLYRYSAYISASHILRREFAGSRLDIMFKKYPPGMANYWPYLRKRRTEAGARKQQFLRTFLGRSLAAFPSIMSQRLWTCDNTKYLLIAVRFLLTSFFYRVSIGLNVSFGTLSVLNVEEVIQGEICKVTTILDGAIQFYYALEATCEVIGLPSLSTHNPKTSEGSNRTSSLVRADWTGYIESRLQKINHSRHETLQDRLSWPNHEEYDHGISKNWINRVKGEWEAGLAKLAIARRYVLACLVANSLSGRHMTSMEMDQEFNGMSDGAPHVRKVNQRQDLNLYLPSHHLVESVHITSRRNVSLHPAVATVQTLGREYFILRDNGLQIGTEEDGICEEWKGILRCNSEGVSL